jgi:biopolymer transport protein ExbB/TolQ
MPNAPLDPIALFLQAGPAVKGVIVALIFASLWCWAIIFTCTLRLMRLRAALARATAERSSASFHAVFEAGVHEARSIFAGESYEGRRARVTASMRRRVQERIEEAQGGLVNLAVISSVAPFIGLFGTVWGIMTSFIGIAAAHDTSLAVVAPGIAEALAATAIGLAAAIPAAFAYNRLVAGFTRAGRALTRLVEDNVDRVIESAGQAPGDGAP